MSRTKHHNEYNHIGHDFGGKHKCNRSYNQSYGRYGRIRLHKELRMQDKRKIREELDLKAEADQNEFDAGKV